VKADAEKWWPIIKEFGIKVRWSDPQRSCEGQQLAVLMLATQPLCEGLLRVRLGRSLWSSRTPAPPSPAGIATDNQVVALGPQKLVHHCCAPLQWHDHSIDLST
jgi:hypothetical protein